MYYSQKKIAIIAAINRKIITKIIMMTIMFEKMKRTFINSQKKSLFEPTCSFITIILLLLYTILCFGMLSAISNAKERKKKKIIVNCYDKQTYNYRKHVFIDK